MKHRSPLERAIAEASPAWSVSPPRPARQRARAPSACSTGDDEVALAWALTADGLRHVSWFAALPRAERPRNTRTNPRAVLCPVCERPVILRLGRERAHHAAHAPGDVCAVHRPETALHVNAKYWIAARLEEATGARLALRVAVRCAGAATNRGSGARPCDRVDVIEWIAGWDRVELERGVGDGTSRRVPDVTLYRGDRPIAAVEVFASHAVGEEKARVLAAMEVPWIEVRATPSIAAGDDAWTLAAPLPAHRLGPGRSWRCPTHQRAARLDAIERDRANRAERNRGIARAVRIVDLYRASGRVFRLVYAIVERTARGVPRSIALERNGEVVCSLPLAGLSDEQRRSALRDAFRRDVRRLTTAQHAIADSPMRWAAGPAAEHLARAAAVDVSGSGAPPLTHTHPLRYRYDREAGRWRLPDSLRDLRWDRAGDDLVLGTSLGSDSP